MRLLLVEDEPFIALDLETLVRDEGHEVVGIADCYASAIALAASHAPDAAFVDLNLRDGLSGIRIARTLTRDYGVAVAFVTGSVDQIPRDFAGASGVVEKPFCPHGIAELIGIVRHALEGLAPPSTRYARAAEA